jgi:signal transduction histidine kinase
LLVIEQTCAAPGSRFRLSALAATAGIAVLTGLTIWGEAGSSLLILDVVVGVVSCVVVPVLLRRPVLGGLAVSLLAVLSPAATPVATMAALNVARWRRFVLAGTVAGVGIAAHVVRGLWRPAGGLSYGWWLALMVASYAALVGWGALAQSRHALLESLRERARRAEAEQGLRVAEARALERTRIAREMHDVLAHRLSLVATYAGALEYRPDAPPEQLARAAGVVRTGVHQALDELRVVVGMLRDPDRDDDGRPQPVLADVQRLVEESRDAGATVTLDALAGDVVAVPQGIGRTAYRIIQEGLTNARKHAPGSPVRITMAGQPGERLTIDIRNPARRAPILGDGSDGSDGRGLATRTPGTGTGLIGLTERVQLSGGQLGHDLVATGEFHLHAWLPWPT